MDTHLKKNIKKLLPLFFWLCLTPAFSQEIKSHQYSQSEIDSILTPQVRKQFSIGFDIYRVYEFQDKAGLHLIVMTENPSDSTSQYVSEPKDTIKAYCFQLRGNKLKLLWSFADYILKKDFHISQEISITHWTKYFEIGDYNHDGLVDPIMVYGTLAEEGTSDGRMRILVYYKGEKRILRHQNSPYDNGRKMNVVPEFYGLPNGILNRVQEIMTQQYENDHAIFPVDWKKRMNKKELVMQDLY